MSLNIDPKFAAWAKRRQIGQKTSPGIATRQANPTDKAGTKNSNGTPSKGAPHKAKKLATSTSVGRPKGKVRATNNPSLNSKKG